MSTAERDALVRALGAGVQLPVLSQAGELEPYSHDFGGMPPDLANLLNKKK